MNDTVWYMLVDGQQKGPFSIEVLKNKISRDTLVWRAGLTDWVLCVELNEFKDLFSHIPPPIPNAADQSEDGTINYTPVQLSKMNSAYGNSIILIVISFIAGIIELTGHGETKAYSILTFVSGVTYVRVLLGLKYFLNHLKSYCKANANIIWMIILALVGYTSSAFYYRSNWEQQINGDNYLIVLFIGTVLVLLQAYHNIALAVKLLKIEGTDLQYFRAFAVAEIMILGIFIGMSFFDDAESFAPTFIELVLDLIPISLLSIGFYQLQGSVQRRVNK